MQICNKCKNPLYVKNVAKKVVNFTCRNTMCQNYLKQVSQKEFKK